MVKINLPYVDITCAKGREYPYYRRGGKRIPLPVDIYSLEFSAEYQRIHKSFENNTDKTIKYGTVEAIVNEYKASADFNELSAKSKEDYRGHLNKICDKWGDLKITYITRKVVLTYRDSLKDKKATANYRMAVLRKLMSFAIDRGYIEVNPASKPGKMETGSWEPWTDEQIASMLKTDHTGLKTAMYLALYTGQREADILVMLRARPNKGRIQVKQHKTKKPLDIPIHRNLAVYLDWLNENIDDKAKATLTIVTRADGKPFQVSNFRHVWKDEMVALGIEGVVFHGLRKNATHYLLEAGCTEQEVMAITGMSAQMVAHYAKRINQSRLADSAMLKFENHPSLPNHK